MFCTSCGTKNENDAKFCRACGKLLISDANPTAEQSVSNELYSGASQSQPVAQTVEQPAEVKPASTEETIAFNAISSIPIDDDFVTAQLSALQAEQEMVNVNQPVVDESAVYQAEQPITPPEYIGEPTEIIYENQEPPKKKRKIGLIIGLAVAVIVIAGAAVSTFMFGFFGVGRGDPEDLYTAYLNMVDEGIITFEEKLSYSGYGVSQTGSYKVSEDFNAKTIYGEGQYESNQDVGYTYNDGSDAYRYKYAYDEANIYSLNYDIKSGEITESEVVKYNDGHKSTDTFEQLELFRGLFDNGELDIDRLLEMEKYENVKKSIENDKYTKKEFKKAAEEFFQNLCDKEWMENNLNFSCESSFMEQVYTVTFNEYDTTKILLEAFKDLMDEDEYEQAQKSLEKKKDRLDLETTTYVFTVSFDKIKSVKVTYHQKNAYGHDDFDYSVEITFIDSEAVDVNKVKKEIDKYNEGYTDCRECNCYTEGQENGESVDDFEEAVSDIRDLIKGYCNSCYREKFCAGNCGNEPVKNGYCNDCYIQCVSCMNKYGIYKNKVNGQSYCSSCFHEKFCDCGNPITKDDYCDDCYIECAECHEKYASLRNLRNEKFYCYSCYDELFCDCGKDVYKEGYCEDCYSPCIACIEKAGDDNYKGYCRDCYYERFCNEYDCGEVIYKDGYCKEHFVACVICGEKYGQPHYDGLCHVCYSSYTKCSICNKYVSNVYDGLCDDCYRTYDKCDKCYTYKADVYDGLCGDCHKIYKKCERCDDYSSIITDGLCDWCARYYKRCSHCGEYASKTVVDHYGMCYGCYY